MKARHAANNRRIVAEAAVAVNFAPVGKNALDIIQRVGTLRMTRQFRALPGVQVRRNLAAKAVHPLVQLLDLAQRFRVLPLQRLQARDLLLDFFQFLLRFQSRIHFDDIPILLRMMRFHHREHEVRAGDGGILRAYLFAPSFCITRRMPAFRPFYFRSSHRPHRVNSVRIN